MGLKMRLDKWLSNMGRGSRNEVKDALKNGWVKVNGEVVKSGKEKYDVDLDEVVFDGEVVPYKPFVYLMMNKPQDVISATQDSYHQTVLDLIEPPFGNMPLFPVGRLDIDTEGFLLLTNDGALSHQLLSPKKHVPKTYRATISGLVTQTDVEAFEKGVTLDDGYVCQSANLKILSIDGNTSEIEVVLFEGKFHQVKRMFEAVNKEVVYLKRIAMGGLALDPELELGAYRELTEDELIMLQKG